MNRIMSDNKDTRKMLLEDFWEDVDLDLRDEGSFDKEEVERAHKSGLERTQHDYKYYIIINTVWKKCYEKNKRTIMIGRVRQRIESILTHICSKDSISKVYSSSLTRTVTNCQTQ